MNRFLRKILPLVSALGILAFGGGCIVIGERVEPWETFARIGPRDPEIAADNGDGTSFKKAFVLHGLAVDTPSRAAMVEEQFIFSFHEQEPGLEYWQHKAKYDRTSAWNNGREYDVITVTRLDGTKKTYYVDTSRLRLRRAR